MAQTRTPVCVPKVADTVPELLRRRLDAERDLVAIVGPDGSELTCGTWYDDATALARRLVGRGIRPGERIWLVADNRDWTRFAVSYLATLMAGGVAVPVSASTYSVLSQRADVAPALTVLHDGAHVRASRWEVVDYETLLASAQTADRLPELSGDMPAEISHTAGTEGQPKPVLSYHETLCVTYTSEILASQPAQGWRYLLALPFGNTFAQTIFLDALQVCGSRLYVAPDFRPADFVERLGRFGIEATFLVPTMVEALIREPDLQWSGARGLKMLCVSGAPARAQALTALSECLPDTVVVNSYCSTETWPAGTEWVYCPGEPLSAGTPWEGRELRIEDADGHVCASGVTGVVCLRSRGVRQRQPLPVAPDAAPDGWIRTDDLGFVDEKGRLHLVGRRNEVFTTGGLQIAPALLEAALVDHPAVHDAVVVPSAHPSLHAIPVALVVTTEPVAERELLATVIEAVGPERAPRAVYEVPEVPRNEAGKTDRAAAAELLARVQRKSAALDGSAPMLPYLAGLCAELLRLTAVPAGTANFFEIGGDSIAVLRLCRRFRHDYGVSIGQRLVFENPGIRDLADMLTQAIEADMGDNMRRASASHSRHSDTSEPWSMRSSAP